MVDKKKLAIVNENFKERIAKEGSCTSDDHLFFAVADYVLYSDIKSFFKHMKAASIKGFNFVSENVENEKDGDNNSDFLKMLNFCPSVFSSLIAQDFDRAHKLAEMMGGRPKVEKEEHAWSRTFGYIIKASVLRRDDLAQRLADFDKTLARKDVGVSYQGYGQFFHRLTDKSVTDVTPALEHISKYHKRRDGTVDEKALCLWGIALANLALYQGKTVTIDTEVIPKALLYKP